MALTKVSTDGVKDDAITKAKIPANQIENSELANNAVSTVNIAANTVTTAILQDASVTLAKLEHGTSSNNGKFLRANNGADPTFETVNTDLVSDTTPQLGGNLASNGNDIKMADTDEIEIGNDGDLKLYHDGSNSYLLNSTGNLILKDLTDAVYIQAPSIIFNDETTNENIARFLSDGACELYHDNGLRLSTESSQVTIHRPSAFPNPNNTGAEITGATLDIGGNLHLEERYPNGAYADRQDLVLKTNTGYGQGLNDKVRFSSSGSIFLEVAGAGISFEPHGSSNVNLLDDYEEGTWTPVIGSGSTTNIYSPKYTKIGNLCTISFSAYGFSDNSSNTSLYFTGLPFTSSSQGGAGLSVGACFTAKFTIAANIISYVGASTTTIRFYDHGTGDYDAVRHNHINGTDTTHRIFTTITYTTA